MKHIVSSLKYIFTIALFSGLLSACGKSEEKAPTVVVLPQELSFTSAGTMQRFEIKTTMEWTLTAPDWVICSPAHGSGTAIVYVTADANTGSERSGEITLAANDERIAVGVTQESVDFKLSHTTLSFDGGGTPIEVTVISKFDWTIDIPSNGSWLTATPSSGGPGMTNVIFTPKPFTSRNPRDKELISIDYGVSNMYVIISQTMPNEAPVAPALISPAKGAADIAANTFFTWEPAIDPDDDILTYELQVSPDNGFSWPFTVTTRETTAQLFNQILNKRYTYTWRVVVSDPFGGESTSAHSTFTTGDEGHFSDGDVVEWQHETSGAPRPVHMVFLGDGYIPEDYIAGGTFDNDVQKAIDAVFSVEPYTTYRNYFRISSVVAFSQERGATILKDMGSFGPGAQNRNTVFKTVLDGNGTGVSGNVNQVFTYAKKVPEVTDNELHNVVIFVLINVDAYAGTCHMWADGRAIAYCPLGKMDNNGQPAYKSIIVHEGAGHGFGRLVDEYRYYNEPIDNYSKELINTFRRSDPWYGWNVSFINDPSTIHWKHYFMTPGYEAVGIYEGAMQFTQRVWRPEQISCMDDNRPYFNAPSREVIVRRIYRISGMTFDFDTFVSKDRIKSTYNIPVLGSTHTPVNFVPLAPPVLIMDE